MQTLSQEASGRPRHSDALVPRRLAAALAIATVALLVATLGPAGAVAAEPPLLREFCKTGTAGGQCVIPRGIAVDPASGDAYVADQSNKRIQKFTAWGQFLHAWGWDVVASGPGDDTIAPEDQFEVCVPADGDVCKAGLAGGGAGQLGNPQGVAVDSSGDVFVVDLGNSRIQKFSPDGKFLLTFGGDVIASGPNDSPNDEVQEVSVASTSGTFKLGFEDPRKGGGKQETSSLPFNASAAEVETALNGLSTISGFGGSVSVTGGPGDATGSNPYAVTFEGDLGGDELPQLSIDRSSLGPASIGARLVCSTDTEAKTISYQWLRNGVPILGATSPTYETTSEDEGEAVQCQVTATNLNAGSLDVANPVYVAPPVPGNAPPVAPSSIQATVQITNSSRTLFLGGSGGQTIICDPGEWNGAESFAYKWYRNGVQIPGAAASIYVTTASDVATDALFQCAVTGANASGTATTKLSPNGNDLATNPPPIPRVPTAIATLQPPSNVYTSSQGGAPEICRLADVCEQGLEGTGSGQFDWSYPGQGGIGSYITIDQDSPGAVYIGDKERIQKFDSGGAYLGDLPDPGGVLSGQLVQSLAIDPFDNLYLRLEEAKEVLKLNAASGAEVCETGPINNPTAIATGSAGRFYVLDVQPFGGSVPTRVLEFASGCGKLTEFAIGDFDGGFGGSRAGIATSSACGIDGTDLFISKPTFDHSFVRIYGPPPDIDTCPPPSASPTIASQYAVSVDASGAVVRAKINPHFWSDTRFWVQYGTGKCSEGGCEGKALFPGALLGDVVVDAEVTTQGVFLGGLEPDTTYHYRFIAESELSGAPQAIGEGEGQEEGTLHTYPPPSEPGGECPNQDFRTGLSARLPDCRAYELVSPVDKNNSDITKASEAHDLSSIDGNAFTYATLAAAYANPLSAPFATQYLSERDPETGWQTRSISPPRKLPTLYDSQDSVDIEYRAFSDDLCDAWVIQYTDLALASGAPAGVPNLYRRENCGEQSGTYETLTTVAPTEPAPGFSDGNEPGKSKYFLHPQGASADGSISVFRAPAKLTPNAAGQDLRQLYAHSKGQLHLVSVLPTGNAASTHASVGTFQSDATNDFRRDSVDRAVSADGSRIFWSAGQSEKPTREGGGLGEELGALYVRVDPTDAQSVTKLKKCTEPDRACTLEIAKGGARYITAAVDGSFAIYMVGKELFEYDVAKGIAYEAEASKLIAKGVVGVMGASDDVSRVYLVSTELLTGEASNSEGASASPGKPNLYLYRRGVGFAFVGTLGAEETDAAVFDDLGGSSPVNLAPLRRTSRVSPDGLHAAFTSSESLTGYDNTDVQSEQPDAEVFLYDAAANGGEGELRCASCNPSGARPAGREVGIGLNGKIGAWAAAQIPSWINQLHPGRILAEDGSRLFFESFDALLPLDANGRKDVYEWKAPGSGDCTEESDLYFEANEGCIGLISSGQGGEDSELVDASANGRDVFILTGSSLLPQDSGLRDVYNAREGGGFPAPPAPPVICEGEACQGTPTPPEDPTPASSTYEGAGNLTEGVSASKKRRCPKGRHAVRKAGRTRCLKTGRKQGRQRAKRNGRASR